MIFSSSSAKSSLQLYILIDVIHYKLHFVIVYSCVLSLKHIFIHWHFCMIFNFLYPWLIITSCLVRTETIESEGAYWWLRGVKKFLSVRQVYIYLCQSIDFTFISLSDLPWVVMKFNFTLKLFVFLLCGAVYSVRAFHINEGHFRCVFPNNDAGTRRQHLNALRQTGYVPGNADEAAVFLAHVYHETGGLKLFTEQCAPGRLLFSRKIKLNIIFVQ